MRILAIYYMVYVLKPEGGSEVRISLGEVRHVARLARLILSPDEEVRFQRELSTILDYMDMLKEVPAEGIEPTFHAHSITNALREDAMVASPDHAEALRIAPAVHEGAFAVPRIIDEG